MNKNLQGGYYIVSLGGVDLLGASVSLPNIAKLLYEAKKHKFVVLQDIVMDGVEKTAIPVFFDATMALTTEPEDWDESEDGEFVAEEVYTATIYNVYGKNIAIDAEGGATITDYLIAEVDPADLYGKFVRIVKKSDFDQLTGAEKNALVEGGFFIEGGLDLGANSIERYVNNPVVFPGHVNRSYGGYDTVIVGCPNPGDSSTNYYNCIPCRFDGNSFTARPNTGLAITGGSVKVYNKLLLNGVEMLNQHLYMHTITFNVSGGTTFLIRIVSDSSTACALDSVSGNFVIAGATCLVPSNMGNAVLTPFDANGFNPDIHLFDSATGAYSTAVTLSSVESDVITPIG